MNDFNFPALQKSRRNKAIKVFLESTFYQKKQLVYGYMFLNKSHRQLDEEVFGIMQDKNKSHQGFTSMNVLHYIGLKKEHKNIFFNKSVDDIVTILEENNSEELLKYFIGNMDNLEKEYKENKKGNFDLSKVAIKETNLLSFSYEKNDYNQTNIKNGKGRNRNYNQENATKQKNGLFAEELVLKSEEQRFIDLGKEEYVKKIEWVSKTIGDGLGYDIKSFDFIDDKIQEIYIEVKSSMDKKIPYLKISSAEIEFSKNNKEKYFMYIVLGIGEDEVNLIKLKGDIENHFELQATNYQLVTAKKHLFKKE